jgi:hypothetical protein
VQWLGTPEEVSLGAQALPPLLTVAGQCITAGDEDTVMMAYETLIEVCSSSFDIVEGHLTLLVKHMLQVCPAASYVRFAQLSGVKTLRLRRLRRSAPVHRSGSSRRSIHAKDVESGWAARAIARIRFTVFATSQAHASLHRISKHRRIREVRRILGI